MKKQYIAGSEQYNTIKNPVAAPLFMRVFDWNKSVGKIEISATGFYRLFLNGKELTKGFFAPYISNPDDVVYYDEYDVGTLLKEKGNEIYVLLGNGFNNCNDNNCWDFEKAGFRSAPKFYLGCFFEKQRVLTTDEEWLVSDSPIIFDDLRCGEHFDARIEPKEWHKPILVENPKGEYRKCTAQPVQAFEILHPISVHKAKKGYIYDFGQENTGLCRLKLNGKAGQEIRITHGEALLDGELDLRSVSFAEKSIKGYIQQDRYICKDGEQEYIPSFTYHGFRYVCVEGITEAQATKELLEFVVIHSNIPSCGNFSCSDEMINRIQECTRRSDTSNFHYFPTDCPQREKNGWTADASLSAEQLLYNFDCAVSLREWLYNIRKAQTKEGKLPGIIPTAGWGFEWGNGPAWDSVLIELPYQIYRFTGDKSVIEENIEAIELYFSYLSTRKNEHGLVAFGLGDWCEAGVFIEDQHETPIEITDSLVSIDIAKKASFMAEAIGNEYLRKKFDDFGQTMKQAFRYKYVKGGALTFKTQTTISMAVGIGILTEDEEAQAKFDLIKAIEKSNGHFKVGVIGVKYLFDVLTKFGYANLAYKLITQPTFPSYVYNINQGATTLWEAFNEYMVGRNGYFRKDGGERIFSFNHHFWGSVSAWFYRVLGGLYIESNNFVRIAPNFVPELNFAEAEYERDGKYIKIRWERQGEQIKLSLRNIGFIGNICLDEYYVEGQDVLAIEEGDLEYVLHRI